MSGSITATTPPADTAPRGGPRLSADLNTFLRLLTTQLRNQDPTKPMDTEALTQQLVQFATVEQQIAGNQTLQRMLDLQQAGQLAATAPLMGRVVTVATNRLPLQDGRAELVLPPTGRATRANIEIRDASGALLRTETVALGAAQTRWAWDGRDMRGTRRADGAYAVAVTGRAADGTPVPLDFAVSGRVTGAARADGDLVLRLGAVAAGFDRLRELPGTP
ncbi:flagellar hook assembly protein FlgD [Falsiroseomonas oryziterrae]|uniref:flagellar hook assembly protein FlgD n=1 Tax=Falsiroseomonas oryziterrae TaxID=2911368 RepID=UPI001F22477B|nr:flagellar hook assembly protein FlgD [Roseomonas sp. NPKOSM-4]